MISGGCLCGKVRYTTSSPPISQGICYCSQCQKTGGAFGSPLMVLQQNTFECTSKLLSFCKTTSDRGSTVMRYFCKECGCHVFAQITDVPEIVTLRAATLDDCNVFRPEYLVFTRGMARSCAPLPQVPSFLGAAPLGVVLGRAELSGL